MVSCVGLLTRGFGVMARRGPTDLGIWFVGQLSVPTDLHYGFDGQLPAPTDLGVGCDGQLRGAYWLRSGV